MDNEIKIKQQANPWVVVGGKLKVPPTEDGYYEGEKLVLAVIERIEALEKEIGRLGKGLKYTNCDIAYLLRATQSLTK